MANPIIYHILPSQQGMTSKDLIVDCLEKIKLLALSMSGNDFLLNYANEEMLHHYAVLIDDLAEIAVYHHHLKEKEEVLIN